MAAWCTRDAVADADRRREPSLDAESWAKRESRYKKKIEAGRCHIPTLFPGIPIPKHIEQIALFAYGGRQSRTELAGGRVLFIEDFMNEVRASIGYRKVSSAVVPEEYPLLRTLQFAAQY